jgi:hypothetical protein
MNAGMFGLLIYTADFFSSRFFSSDRFFSADFFFSSDFFFFLSLSSSFSLSASSSRSQSLVSHFLMTFLKRDGSGFYFG